MVSTSTLQDRAGREVLIARQAAPSGCFTGTPNFSIARSDAAPSVTSVPPCADELAQRRDALLADAAAVLRPDGRARWRRR